MRRIPCALVVGIVLLVEACAPVPPRPSGASSPEAAPDPSGVRWIRPTQDADRRALDAWRRATGDAVLHARTVPVAAQADSLVLISWNLHSGGGDIFALVEDVRRGVLTGEPEPHFVLLLQEAFRIDATLPAPPGSRMPRRIEAQPPAGPRRDILDIARSLDLWLVYVPSMRNGAPGSGATEEDRGSAILSTLPLEDPTAIELPFESQRRVAVAATVRGRAMQGTAWELRVCSAHLDPRSAGMRFFSSFGSGRLRQARFLVEALPQSPAVVAGDLNTWSLGFLEPALNWFRRHFPSTPSPPGKSFTIPWWRDRRLDHMVLRLPETCAARYVLVRDTYGSDHRPLLGWITCGAGGVPDRAQ